MKKIIFFTTPHLGHINPSKRVINNLIQQKFQVDVYTTQAFIGLYEEMGCGWHLYKKEIYQYNNQLNTVENKIKLNGFEEMLTRNISFYEFSLEIADLHISDIKEKPPVVILFDSYAVWGKIIADRLKIPCICLECYMVYNYDIFLKSKEILYRKVIMKSDANTNLNYDEIEKTFYSELKMINRIYAKKIGIETFQMFDYVYTGDLTLVLISSKLQPYRDCLNEKYVFIGGNGIPYESIEKKLRKTDQGNGQIYVTQGTMPRKDKKSFFQYVIQEFEKENYQLILNIPEEITREEVIPTENSNIYPFVNQLEVLSASDYFISHGGVTGIIEAIMLGVPIICTPDSIMEWLISIQVRLLGIGLIVEKEEMVKDSMKNAIKMIEKDYTINENLALVRQYIQQEDDWSLQISNKIQELTNTDLAPQEL